MTLKIKSTLQIKIENKSQRKTRVFPGVTWLKSANREEMVTRKRPLAGPIHKKKIAREETILIGSNHFRTITRNLGRFRHRKPEYQTPHSEAATVHLENVRGKTSVSQEKCRHPGHTGIETVTIT